VASLTTTGTSRKLPAELVALQTDFERRLGARVAIDKGKKGGKVVIYYYSDEELQAIYDTIVGDD
jgi:ParB family chromosome partitioning protein